MNSNNKGFTLVELIAVIVVLSILIMLASTVFINIRQSTLQKDYENIKSYLETKAIEYASDTNITTINVETLINEGYVNPDDISDIYDPRSGESMNCYIIKSNIENGEYVAVLDDTIKKESGSCTQDDDDFNISICMYRNNSCEDYTEAEWQKNNHIKLGVNDLTNKSVKSYKWKSYSGKESDEELLDLGDLSGKTINNYYSVEVVLENGTIKNAGKVLKVDNEAPKITGVTFDSKDENKKVIVNASDNGSGIYGYSYVKNAEECSSNKSSYKRSNEIIIDNNGSYKFCVIDNMENIGILNNQNISFIEIKMPVVTNVTNVSTNDTITVTTSATKGTYDIKQYYYSIDGSNYVSSQKNTHTFTGLTPNTTYNIKVYVTDTENNKSNEYSLSATTLNLTLFAEHIKSQYSSQGTNGLYYHNSTLKNGAGDNSYRYAGANPNNYVCFGTDASSCPNDNLYRIIGVFGSQVKLIKYDYAKSSLLGTNGSYSATYQRSISPEGTNRGSNSKSVIGAYYWSNSSWNKWEDSELNKINLNTNFLNNIGMKWAGLIANTNWIVSGLEGSAYNSKYSYNAKNTYQKEISSGSTTYNAKVGLMYVSDYGYAATSNYWTKSLYEYDVDESTATSNNWLYMGLYDWTISRTIVSGAHDRAFGILYTGGVSFIGFIDSIDKGVRPAFYLNSTVKYLSGTGSKSNPYRIL